MNSQEKFNQNKGKTLSNHKCDDVFAQLTDMFGDIVHPDIILSVCKSYNWQLNDCVENLIQYTDNNINRPIPQNKILNNPKLNNVETVTIDSEYALQNLKIAYQDSSNSANYEDDADILIESEDIQTGTQQMDYLHTESMPSVEVNSSNLGAIKKTYVMPTSYSDLPYQQQHNFNAYNGTLISSFLKHGSNQFTDRPPQKKQARLSKFSSQVNRITNEINNGHKIMIIMRGAPGSGKSHLAQEIIKNTMDGDYKNHIFTSDDYFYDKHDRYIYNPFKIPEAHDFNKTRVKKRVTSGWSPIIIDNTNLEIWEMLAYFEMGVEFGYIIEILESNTSWAKSAKKLAMKNSHNVPKDKIEIMLNKYQHTTVPDVFRMINLQYFCPMPQFRNCPALPSINMHFDMINRGPQINKSSKSKEVNYHINNDEKFENISNVMSNQLWTTSNWKNIDSNDEENKNSANRLPCLAENSQNDNLLIEPIWTQNWDNQSKIGTSEPQNANFLTKPIWTGDRDSQSKTETNDPQNTNIASDQIWSQNWDNQSKTQTSELQNPNLVTEPIWSQNWDNQSKNQTSAPNTIVSKAPRNNESRKGSDAISATDVDTFKIAIQQLENINTEWTAYEKERVKFWNINNNLENNSKPEVQKHKEKMKSKKVTSSTINNDAKEEIAHQNIFSILRNETPSGEVKKKTEADKPLLQKHRKECSRENKSFSQIRQIYPSVPIDFLWDLFSNCHGDGDWTMDILLKEETRINDYEKLNNKKTKNLNNFDCDCEKIDFDISDREISPIIENASNTIETAYRTRKDKQEENLIVKKQIEENFVISDEHYSNHTRKIRDIRRGIQPSSTIAVPVKDPIEMNACSLQDNDATFVDDTISDSDCTEIIEVNLGTDLVCQLDNIFGIDAFQTDSIKQFKTTVFMPKGLAQQLYALWMESLYNQVEEQRQKSIKDDEEFARQLHAQQKYPQLARTEAPTKLKDIMEMEYAWAAYKTEINDWKRTTPQDLAAQMTRGKLYDIFPNVEKDTLIEVLAAHNNKFVETVDVLKRTLQSSNVEQIIEKDSRELLEQARIETEMVVPNALGKPSENQSTKSLELKKLGPEEAKRIALKDFEECRNLAMHHTQLKAECYIKAQDAIQKADTAVALYYSQIANLHKTKIDMYNHKAANSIMEVHNLTQNNPDMLDLHYLHVVEAMECLDIFLDKHITKLKSMPQVYKYIFVITGRGLHSTGGFSAIKSRTKNRLKERSLTWSEVNPGLLKVKIYTTSKYTINI